MDCRLMRALLLLTMLACGSAKAAPKTSGDANRAVDLGEWCNTLTQTTCVRAGSCIGSLDIATSCTDSASIAIGDRLRRSTSCLSGRPNMTAVAAHTECQAP
jgi:hypothetical protein